MKKQYRGKKLQKNIVCHNSIHTVIFDNSIGKVNFIKIKQDIVEEFERHRKKEKSYRNEYDRHIEHLNLTETQINKRAIHKIQSAEEIFIQNEMERIIIREIWKLPIPQNRRVYMKVVNKLSYTEIAKIEKRAIPVIKRNIDKAIKNLQENLKKFL